MSKKVYDIVNEKIIEKLQQGTIPWVKPWNDASFEAAHNAVSGRCYTGINRLLLDDGGYLTYRQIQGAGAKLKAGAKSKLVTFWKISKEVDTAGNETGKTIPFLRYYKVFSLKDVEGFTPKQKDIEGLDFIPEVHADNVANCYMIGEGITYHEGGNEAYYTPARHSVTMPKKKHFKSVESFYATLFHELGHSTMKSLNRSHTGYGMRGHEEGVAELCSAYMMQHLRLSNEGLIDNTAEYISGWIKRLKKDPRAIIKIAGAAEKAMQHILDVAVDTPIGDIEPLDVEPAELEKVASPVVVDVKSEPKPQTVLTEQHLFDHILLGGSGFQEGKQRIVEQYGKNKSAKENIAFLKQEYGVGGRSEYFPNGLRGYSSHDSKGISLRLYGESNESDSNTDFLFSWAKVQKRLGELIAFNLYIKQEEPKQNDIRKDNEMSNDDIKLITHEEACKLISSCDGGNNYRPIGKFIAQERDIWCAIDNSNGWAWTETFPTHELAVAYLKDEIESDCAEEIEDVSSPADEKINFSITLSQEEFEARNICREVPTDDGKGLQYEYVIELTPSELEQAYRIKEEEYMLLDLEQNLDNFYDNDTAMIKEVLNNKKLCEELISNYQDRCACEDYLDWYAVFKKTL